jgi:predicted ABC-type ATPase
MSTTQPTIYLIADCNGARKTTFAKEFLPHEVKCLNFLNADQTSPPRLMAQSETCPQIQLRAILAMS